MSIKSLICPIEGNSWDVERALNEVDGFSRLQGLGARQSERLRLIGEELLGMVDGFLVIDNGRFWIEVSDQEYIVNLVGRTVVGERAKAVLESAGHNVEYKGFKGLFKKALDSLDEMVKDSGSDFGFSEQVDAALAGSWVASEEALSWSLARYNDSVERDEVADDYDEMEISVLKKYSKDIVISYRNDRIDIKVIADI